MLGGTAQRFGAALAIANQARALAAFIEPPAQDGRAIIAPLGQPCLAQGTVGGHRVEIHQRGLRWAGFEAELADDLLRVVAQFGKTGTVEGLGVAGQAQHQGLEGALGGLVALIGGLTADRFANLVQVLHGLGMPGQAE
ncbi:hypothetical protein D9M73_152680 [compost metagenome]